MVNSSDHSQVVPEHELQPKLNLHLLLVEDNQEDVELIVLALEAAGTSFTYDTVETLSGCQQMLQTRTYNAVLTDYHLPQFTANQVLKLRRQSRQQIPTILVTGNLGEEAAVDCIKAGITDYVLKEHLFRLPIVLERALQEFELRRQKQQAIARIHRQAQQEAIINRIVQAMRGTLVLEQVLQKTADQLHEALNASSCLIFQPDAQGQMKVQYVSATTIEPQRLLGLQSKALEHYKDQLTQGNQVLIGRTSDQTLAPEVQSAASQLNAYAFLLSPLLDQEQFLGVIGLQQCAHLATTEPDNRERQWNAEEISLVKAISDQCAIAIHQAQLFSQVQKQVARERTLSQISRELNSSLYPEYLLQEIVKLTGECFDVERVIIFSLREKKFQVAKEWRSNETVVSIIDFKDALLEWPEMLGPNSSYLRHQAFHAPNCNLVSHSPGRAAFIQQAQILSALCVPIFIRDQLFGGIALHTTTRYRTFTTDEIQLLEGIADQAAIALYNAQSYELLEQLVKERTQELEAEKLLSEAANRSKSEFLSNMSHELRTPLTGILGFSSILFEQVFGPLNPKQKEYVEGISICGKQLLELINDLLDLAKVEAGKEELITETLDIEEVCQACLFMFKERCNHRGLQLSMKIAPDVTTCIADQRRLKQILVNLLSNAVKFTESGSVTLKVEQTAKEITFAVIDTGIGIAEAAQAVLFQPFQQLDSGLNRKYEGTGLGLALSRKLARLHGGDITLESQLGHGSCFTLNLPR